MIIKITISDEDVALLTQLWEDPKQKLITLLTEAVLSQRRAALTLPTPITIEIVSS